MKQAEKKSKAKSKNTVPLSKSEYETVNLLNCFDSNVKFQISVVNVTNDDDFEDVIRLPERNDEYNDIRKEYCDMLRDKLAKGNNGFIRVNYITFSITLFTLNPHD